MWWVNLIFKIDLKMGVTTWENARDRTPEKVIFGNNDLEFQWKSQFNAASYSSLPWANLWLHELWYQTILPFIYNSKTDTRTRTFYITMYLKRCCKRSQKLYFRFYETSYTKRSDCVPKWKDDQETDQITTTSKGNNTKQLKCY